MSDFDVIIVGGGIAGASLGAEIAGKRRTLIVEAEEHCGYHSTGRSAAFYLESYGGPLVAQLTLASGEFLENPPPDFSEHGFLARRGALHLSEGEWPEVPPSVTARRVGRPELETTVPGLRAKWVKALLEPGCADIDVAALHAAFLRQFRGKGGRVRTRARLIKADPSAEGWTVKLEDGAQLSAAILVNAAGAWADGVAEASGVAPLGISPK